MLGGKVAKIGQKAVLKKRHRLYDFSHYDFEVRAFREKTCRKASWTWCFKLEVQQHQRFAEIQSFEVLNSSSFGTKEALINIVTQSLTSCNFIQCIVNASQWMLVPILNLTAILGKIHFSGLANVARAPCTMSGKQPSKQVSLRSSCEGPSEVEYFHGGFGHI